MTLAKLDKNDFAKIVNINGDEDLINRLASFGVLEDSEIKVVQFSLAKNTMEIDCEGTALALRIKEANLIEVEKI
jgi:ferrous iron transport protein A